MTKKLENGKDILLADGESLTTFINVMTNETVYSSNMYQPHYIDGTEYLAVFPKPISPKNRRVGFVKKDALKRVAVKGGI